MKQFRKIIQLINDLEFNYLHENEYGPVAAALSHIDRDALMMEHEYIHQLIGELADMTGDEWKELEDNENFLNFLQKWPH